MAAYLNLLLGRSHNLIYIGHESKASGLVFFYRDTYPRVFREVLPQTLLAVAIFAIAALAGWAMTFHDPGFARLLLGPRMMEKIDRREMWTDSVVTLKTVAASAITTNNLAGGIHDVRGGHHGDRNHLADAAERTASGSGGGRDMARRDGSLVVELCGAAWRVGASSDLHRGGAGLEIARGLLFPGLLPRRESLTRAGGRASRLLLGTIPMLLVAGTIEGFFSPTKAPVAMKFVLAGALFAALIAYLSGAGRTAKARPFSE